MYIEQLIGIGNERFVKTLLVYPLFLATAKQDCRSVWIKRKRHSQLCRRRLATELFHVWMS